MACCSWEGCVRLRKDVANLDSERGLASGSSSTHLQSSEVQELIGLALNPNSETQLSNEVVRNSLGGLETERVGTSQCVNQYLNE